MKILKATQMERCIGCNSCTLACARLVHGHMSLEHAGIRIASSGGLSTGFFARVCLACDPAPCADACPMGALVPKKGGGVLFKEKACTRCGSCAPACPVDAIVLDEEQRPYVCIHCGQCVSFCPHDCLEMGEVHLVKEGDSDAA